MTEAETALRAVLKVVQDYLAPGGGTEHEAMCKIIEIVDPWPLASAPAQPAAMDLHGAIMNLPCPPHPEWNGGEQEAHKIGHRDARHAAAELALTHRAPDAAEHASDRLREAWGQYTEAVATYNGAIMPSGEAPHGAGEDFQESRRALFEAVESFLAGKHAAPASKSTPPAPKEWRKKLHDLIDDYGNACAADAKNIGRGGSGESAWIDRACNAMDAYLDAALPTPAAVTDAGSEQWKCGNEYLPYHPSASHAEPAYRDGWNACYHAALAASATPASDEAIALLHDIARWQKCPSPTRQIKEFGTLAAWGDFAVSLWGRFDKFIAAHPAGGAKP